MAEKAPYKLTVKLDSSRSDAIGEAMQSLRDIAGDYDQTGEASATITMESYQEDPLRQICDAFEEWLYKHAIGLGCDIKLQHPGLRPEMLAALRARHATPMGDAGWTAPTDDEEADESGDVLVTEPPAEVAGLLPSPMLALPAPDDELVINAEFTVDAD